MREKRNKIALGTLSFLVCVLVYLLFIKSTNSTSSVDKNIFKVADTKAIDKVQLLSLQDTVVLYYNGSRWMVNETNFADRDMVDVLFATILQAEPKRLLTGAQRDSLLTQLEKYKIQVSLFENNAITKQFWAGGNERKTQAYFIDEVDQLYAVNIPGYKVYASGIFEQPAVAWYDKSVFTLNWVNFKKLTVNYPTQKENNFEVELTDGVFEIQNLATDTTKLNDFLDAISFFTVDEYASAVADSSGETDMIVRVVDLRERVYSLTITKTVKDGKTLCFVKNNQPAWVDWRKLTRLLKSRQFFAKSQ